MPKISYRTPIVLICFLMQGCGFNGVRETSFAASNVGRSRTQIVVGIGTASDVGDRPFGIIIEKINPNTGEGGNCVRWNHAEIDGPQAPLKFIYRVFDVPPGVYAFSRSWAKDWTLQNPDPTAFTVSEGKTAYVGDYILVVGRNEVNPFRSSDGKVYFKRNLNSAKAALGKQAAGMELAPIIANAPRPIPFLCTP